MFQPINGYENLYEINEFGDVKSLSRSFINNKGYECFTKERILKPQLRNSYFFVRLCKNNIKKVFSVHRLVAQCFVPNPENKPFVNHIDGNRLNNNASNLEWVDLSENVLHSYYVLKKNIRPVLCITTNTEYSSIREASRQTVSTMPAIINSFKKGTYTKGVKWKYLD
jgi:hypothetical protein